MRHLFHHHGLLALVVLLASVGCGDSTPPPAAPSPPPVAAPPTVTQLSITGNLDLTAVGETSQLTAAAMFSDGTTKDVTNEAQWRSNTPSVIAVTSTGAVTVVAFGMSGISATYGTRSTAIQMRATPPNTFIVFGRVREPGAGGITGVRVVERQSGRSTLTDDVGEFSLAGLRSARMTFEKDGFEPPEEVDVQPDTRLDVAMQWIVRMRAGETSEPQRLAPNDVSYRVGGEVCQPCRRIRVMVARAGTLRVTLTWTEPPRSMMIVWVNGHRFSGGSAPVTGESPVSVGEHLVYVSGTGGYVSFRLATELVP
jgi:TolB-like protein